MNWLDTLYNRTRVPGFLINSLPKSGTNLLEKAIHSFPGIRASGLILTRDVGLELQAAATGPEMIPFGVGAPAFAPREAAREYLRRIDRGTSALAHLPFRRETADLLRELRMKSVLILRDPRDVALSRARYFPTVPDNRMYSYFRSISPEEGIRVALEGVQADGLALTSIRDALESVLPWRDEPLNYTTSFERLVGPQGGGSREAQVAEITQIARHLGIRHSQASVEAIADHLFGGTRTFHKGTIGAWKECYTPEHKRLAKELLGDWLVRLGYEQGMDW